MELPNQLELQTLFSGFLFEAGLSAVSVKNYLSDLRHFLSFCASISSQDNPPTVQEIFQSVSKYVSQYTDEQRRSFTPQNTINRRLASIRRFSTFLNVKFGLQNEQNSPSHSPVTTSDTQKSDDSDVLPTVSKILERFRVYLVNEKKTHSTIKNYLSDLNHFFAWSAKQTPFIDQKLENLLSETQLNAYVTYLRLNHTSTSVINRRQSSIKKFTKYCFLQNFIPDNPFESKPEVPKLAPLSWLERLKSKPNNSHKTSRNRFVRLYQRYNSLPFTPYLHLALLVLATSAMVIFGYNQIIKQAAPSAAALPTVPRRQLSFQGRLTDSSGTPIVTAVNVVFKLWNDSTAGTQLYTSNTCSITPDSNGIFNTLIGNGTCGQEIASTVFTENRDVYLEITVGSETLTPRQQIATVGYALNSETLQGYPASATATLNTIPLVDQNGDINIAASSPTINSTSGTFTVTGQALTLSTAANSGGDIILQPDALGGGNVQILGSTTSTDTFRIENANLTSGSLISGYIGNNTATGNLLSLTSGSTETDRFLVGANGRTIINTNGGTDSIFSASSSGTTRFTIASNGNLLATGTLSGLTGLTVASGTVSLPAGEINNTEISELDWTKLQNYPTACPAGQAVQAVGDTLTCVDIAAASGNLWQRTSGSLAPLYTSDSLNLGSTATSSALVHLAGTSGENSWINTGNFGVGLTNPGTALDVTGTGRFSAGLTLTSGAINLTSTSGVLSLTGLSASSINTGINTLTVTSSNFNTTATGINSTNIGATTPGTGAFTTLSSTGATTLGNNSSTVAINSNSWDINSSGVASGLTGISSSGNIDLSSLSSGGIVKASATTGRLSIASGGVDYENPLTFSNGLTRSVNAVQLGGTLTADTNIPLGGFDMVFSGTGNVGIGLTNPTYTLDVTGDINFTGALRISGSAGSSTQVLTSTGTGAQWTDSSTLGTNFWQYNGGVLTPIDINGVINLGATATNSALVHLAGTTGDNSFVNTGNFGIGLTNPSYKLDVVGDINLTGALRDNGSAGTSGQILSSTGTGVQWIDAPSGTGTGDSPFTWNTGVIYPKSIFDALNLGNSATNSATVHLAGTAGDNSFINTGNFGIGLTNPSYTLDVVGSVNITGSYLVNGSPLTASNWQRNFGSLAPLNITDSINLGATATSSALVHLAGTSGENSFVNTGNLGVGTTTPSRNLVVNGTPNSYVSVTSDDSGLAGILLGDQTLDNVGQVIYNNGNDSLGLWTAGTEKLSITAGGNVGVGITNPSYDLDVAGDINVTGALRDNGSSGTNGQVLTSTGTGIQWVDQSTITGTQLWQYNGGVLTPVDTNGVINLGSTATNSAYVHLAGTSGDNSFVNTGNFGIGTTNPGSKLTVNGTLTSSGGAINLNSSSNFATNINTGTSTGAVSIGGGSNTVAINSSSWDISTAGAISGITTINMSGQLTSTVATGTAPFAVSSTTVNTNLNADLLDGYHASNFASLTNISGTTNRMAKFTGANSVGNASINDLYNNITMTIDASGNIGIGTTTPNNLLSVGTGTGFQVDGTGAIMNANGATISGSVRLSALGTGILHSNASGYLSSSAINLASSDVTGLLPIANGGTNNSTFTTGKFVAYDGTKLASTSFDETSFETALTFQNGLTRTGSTIEFGGTSTLLHDTTFDQSTYDLAFIGSGNFGIGAASPSQKLDVAGFFVVDTANSRVGIGTTSPTARVEIAGSSSTISNTSGDITFNSASNLFNFSGDTLGNFLDATASGQIRLGNFTDAGRPATNGTGNLIYSTTQQAPQYYNGSTWKTLTNYFSRTAEGILYPTTWNDSINLFASTGDGASASAKIRLSGDSSNNTFFNTPVAIGFTTAMESTAILQTSGSILPKNTAANNNLGKIGYSWANLFLNGGISDDTGLQILSASNRRLTGANWNVTGNLGVGSTTAPTHALEVTGTTSLSGVVTTGANLYVGGTELDVNGGTGKINVGTVDPPYTINGQKYATYMASMIGVKEEVVGNISTAQADYIPGIGYRALLDLDQQPTGSDLWLFGKTTNIKSHISSLSVLLTPEGQARAWYEVDADNKILAIYSSTPTNITYRLTAPRFDSANWTNTRTNSAVGFVINDYNNYSNTTSIFDGTSATPELLAQIDGTFTLIANGKEIREVSSFAESLIANLKAGAAVITNLVADNLTVRTKLVSPLADIDQLKVIDATVSGTLYADNIQGKTVDSLHQEINLLNEKYSTASAILADLQAKYGTYGELLSSTSSATISTDPLALSPLATTSAVIPSDLALNSLNVDTVIANDVMANGSVFAQAISSFDTDLFIQPAGDKAVHLVANIMSIYPNGKVLINGDLLVNGTLLAQAIDTQTATVSGTLAVGTSTIATDSANFNQLTTTGLVIAAANDSATQSGSTQTASNATIGSATIATGAAEINISNTRITDSTLIYVTPTSDTNGSVLFVKAKQTGTGFTVAVSGAANSDAISFNYWLVETK